VVPSPAFFPGAVHDRTAPILDQRMPEHRGQVLAAAEQILAGRFDLLGYRALSFGEPVDWHLDPVNERRAPVRHWSLIDTLDPEQVGDNKVIWELNRHQWLVRLGQAYRLTGEERFAAAFAKHFADWAASNATGQGINWASSLEVAVRLIAWSWARHLIQGSATLTPALEAQVLGAICAHAAHVERYLSYYFSPNTHLTGEALGLFYAGVLLSQVPRAARWRRLGKRILERESERQILPDGIYFEQSTYYQRYTAEIYLHFLLLAERAGVEVSPHVRARVGRLLDAMLVLRRPDGSMPQVGDSDGGRLLPLASRDAADVRDVFSAAAVLFRRADYAWAAGGLAPETLWLLGPDAASRFDGLRPAPPPTPPSRVLPDGGYVVLRSSWAPDADQVILDAGPLGEGAHGHGDLLSIQCVLRGRPYLVDPGTFTYTPNPRWRSYFRGTAAHSTVDVDGMGHAQPRGPFSWHSRPRAEFIRWKPGEAIDFADAEHRAFERPGHSLRHRRRVVLLKGRGACVVVDDLEGAGEHRIDVRFQLAPMPARLDSDLWFSAGPLPGPGLVVAAWSTVPLKATLSDGEVEPPEGWISTDYGVRTRAPMLTYSTIATVPMRILSLLLHVPDVTTHPAATPLHRNGDLAGLTIPGLGTILMDGEGPRWEVEA
jgi:hypothetical protein